MIIQGIKERFSISREIKHRFVCFSLPRENRVWHQIFGLNQNQMTCKNQNRNCFLSFFVVLLFHSLFFNSKVLLCWRSLFLQKKSFMMNPIQNLHGFANFKRKEPLLGYGADTLPPCQSQTLIFLHVCTVCIYQDSKLLVSVVCFAELYQTG